MVERVASATAILNRLLDTAAEQPSLVPSVVDLMQVVAVTLLVMSDFMCSCNLPLQSLFNNAFCPSCVNCEQLLQHAHIALASTKPLQRPTFSLKAITNGSLHAMLQLCGHPQLMRGNSPLIAISCVTGMLLYSQAVITGSAAAASDSVQILKGLAPWHAAALSLHPAAEAAAKCIVMWTGADVQSSQAQASLELIMQLSDHLFAAARLFSDSVGLHVNSMCLKLLQGSAGLEDELRSVVVVILAAVYRSNCTAPAYLSSAPQPALLADLQCHIWRRCVIFFVQGGATARHRKAMISALLPFIHTCQVHEVRLT
jgi:hypothetical protein